MQEIINNMSMVHETIVMPNSELPVKFHELSNKTTGPYVVLHWHDQIEMVYVKRGTITVGCNMETIMAKPGELIFINMNEPHSYAIIEAPVELICCTIDISMLKGRYITSYDPEFITSQIIFEKLVSEDSAIISHFLQMWEEEKRKDRGYEFLIKANFYNIIGLMLRYQIKSIISDKQFHNSNQNLENINKVMLFIEEHYNDDLSLDVLAGHLNFNKYYFCRIFKQIAGMSPIKYLNNYRIHKAMSLMQQSTLSISDILTSVGFNNHNYFSKVFKEVTNEAPSAYLGRLRAAARQ